MMVFLVLIMGSLGLVEYVLSVVVLRHIRKVVLHAILVGGLNVASFLSVC